MPASKVYLNRISTATPPHDVHGTFVEHAPRLLQTEHDRRLFRQMVKRSQIEHRYSFLRPHPEALQLDADGFYTPGRFPGTEARMRFYEQHALSLAVDAIAPLGIHSGSGISHLILTSCTGFYAPGLDLQIIQYYGLSASIERNIIGFMGCQAGINALKLGRHIVRSDEKARVLIINLELCTLHLQETDRIEQLLSFLLFSDGCAASVVSAEPTGMELQHFYSTIIADSHDLITWHIRDAGFDMLLSGQVPPTILHNLPSSLPSILGDQPFESIRHWAVHPGGRSILDAVQKSLHLPEQKLSASRDILRDYGNMSSATIMFVLKAIMQRESNHPGPGCAIAFGPGVTAESMLFNLLP